MDVSIGIDEAGVGPIAGPVVVSCVALRNGISFDHVTDSKKMTAAQRARAAAQITEKAVGIVTVVTTNATIDLYGISYVWESMVREVSRRIRETWDEAEIVLDGNRMVGLPYVKPVVKADLSVLSVSAASVLAKEKQCAWMQRYHERYPQYGFDKHHGYATRQHIQMLREHGPCPIHRKSFAPVRQAIRMWESSQLCGS